VKVLHLHKLTGVSGSEGHLLALLPALRDRGVDARFLGLDVPGTDFARFYEHLDRRGVPHRSVRCGLDASLRMGRDVHRAIRAEDIEISKEGGETILTANWTARVPLVSNISACIDFMVTTAK